MGGVMRAYLKDWAAKRRRARQKGAQSTMAQPFKLGILFGDNPARTPHGRRGERLSVQA